MSKWQQRGGPVERDSRCGVGYALSTGMLAPQPPPPYGISRALCGSGFVLPVDLQLPEPPSLGVWLSWQPADPHLVACETADVQCCVV